MGHRRVVDRWRQRPGPHVISDQGSARGLGGRGRGLTLEPSRSGAVTASGESATPKSGALRKGKVMTARDATTLDRLFETIGTRARADPATSYTAQLLRQATEQVANNLVRQTLGAALAAVA